MSNPMTEWLRAHQHQAYREGWGLFDVDGKVAIQRLDDPSSVFGTDGYLSPDHWEGEDDLSPRFFDDEAAISFVKVRASVSDELAQRALAYISHAKVPA
jgi:hypothetical protein